MRSLNSMFCARLYREGLRQLRLPGFLMGGILCILMLLAPIVLRILMSESELASPNNYIYQMVWSLISPFVSFAPFIMTFILFNFLNKRYKSDFYHALPIKRRTLFCSFTAALLTWLVVSVFVAAMASTLLSAVLGSTAVLASLPLALAVYLPALLFAVAAALLAMSITGTVFTNIVVSALIVYLPALIGMLFNFEVSSAVPALPYDDVSLFGLHIENTFYAAGSILTENTMYTASNALAYLPRFTNLEIAFSVVFTIVLALAILLLAGWRFVRRKSEMAGSSAPSALLQTVYRVAVAMVPLVTISSFISLFSDDSGAAVAIIVLVALSLIMLCSFELIATKKWRNVPRALPSFAIAAVLSVLFSLTTCSVASYEANFAPSAQEISWVRLLPQDADDFAYSYSKELKKLVKVAISSQQLDEVSVREQAASALQDIAFEPQWWSQSERPLLDFQLDSDNSYSITATIEICTTSGRIERRLLPVAIYDYESDDYYVDDEDLDYDDPDDESYLEETVVLTPLGTALVQQTY